MTGSPTRRQFLSLSMLAATAVLVRPSRARAHAGERSISFYNEHTGESVKTVFWADGDYVAEGLREIDWLLRDYRSEEVAPIDPRLIDQLYRLRRQIGVRRPYHVVSGYRSPKTNEILRQSSSGVAKNSYHVRGMAVDIFLPKLDLKALRRVAVELRAGGVGYYPKLGFVHLDSGRVRSW